MSNVTAESVRVAIAGGDYPRALDLWCRYTDAVAAGRLTAESLAEAAALVSWSRPLLLGAREHARQRLRALRVAGVYGARGERQSVLVRESF